MDKDKMIQAVRWYEGDVSSADDPVLVDTKAYVTYNAVFFTGTANEEAKVREKKYLNPAFFSHCEKIYGKDSLTAHIIDAMFICNHPSITTYRVERLYDFQMMQKYQHTISFTSTSNNGFLGNYTDKEGIVLMVCHLSADTPCLVLSSFLPHYAKSEEAEVLLPPWLKMDIQEVPMTKQEKEIKDMYGRPPFGKYEIWFTDLHLPNISCDKPNAEMIATAQDICRCINAQQQYKDISAYELCKKYCRKLTIETMQKRIEKGHTD